MKKPLYRIFLAFVAGLLFLGAANKFIGPINAYAEMPLPYLKSVQLGLVLGSEVFLALGLLFFPNKRLLLATMGLLAVFCAFLVPEMLNGKESCGCFNELGLHRTPKVAIISNLVVIGCLFCLRRETWPAVALKWPLLASLPIFFGTLTFSIYATQLPSNQTLAQLLGGTLDGRDILLKISPTCAKCTNFTGHILGKYHPNRVLAVALLSTQEDNARFEKQFGIPLRSVDPGIFFTIDGKMDIPLGYRIQANRIIPLVE